MKKLNWKYIALIILAIPIVQYVGSYVGKSAAQRVNARDATTFSQPTVSQEIRVVVSSQDAEGVTKEQMDLNFLKNLETYTVERVKIKTKEVLASRGYPNAVINITSEAIYVESGGAKLAVIRLKNSDGSVQIFIAGIVGKELKRVLCVRNSAEAIPISYGPCGERIKEVFGVKVGG